MVRDALTSRAARERGLFRPTYLETAVRGAGDAHHAAARLRAVAGRAARDLAADPWHLSLRAAIRRRDGQDPMLQPQEHRQPAAPAAHAPTAERAGPARRDRTARARSRTRVIDCGWGRLLFGQTFDDPGGAGATRCGAEGPERRDIAFYVSEPHVLLAAAPQELFLDPSHTYRLDLCHLPCRAPPRARGFFVRRLASPRGRRRGQPHLSRRAAWCRCRRTSSGRSATTVR